MIEKETLSIPEQDSESIKDEYATITATIFLPVLFWLMFVLPIGFIENSHYEYCNPVTSGESYHIILNREPCRLTTEPFFDAGIVIFTFGLPLQFLALILWMFGSWKEKKRLKLLRVGEDYIKKSFALDFLHKVLVFSIVLPLFLLLINTGFSILAESFQDYCNADAGCKMLDYILSCMGHNIHLLGYCLLFQSVVLIGWGMVSVYDRLRKWKNK